jgi:hypothetical protein
LPPRNLGIRSSDRERRTDEEAIGKERILRILKEARRGRHGISERTFYRWRRYQEEQSISEARRLRELEKGSRGPSAF